MENICTLDDVSLYYQDTILCEKKDYIFMLGRNYLCSREKIVHCMQSDIFHMAFIRPFLT